MSYRLFFTQPATLTESSAVSRWLLRCSWALSAWLVIGLASGSAAYATIQQEPIPTEQVHLQLSEEVVAAGQTLWLQGILAGEANSTVLYVEVMSRGGAVWQGAFPVQKRTAQGSIPLPDTLASGWYQVRAYTQWMRNAGASSFATHSLLVINPYRETEQIVSDVSPPRSAETSPPGSATPPPEVAITLDRKSYHPRDTMLVSLRLNSPSDTALVTVSVRRVRSLNHREVTGEAVAQEASSSDRQYPVEDEGFTISGSVQETKGDAIGRMATLFIPAPDPYFEYNFVDTTHRFHLPVSPDQRGRQDVILQMSDTSLRVQWTLDEKFAPENTYGPASLPTLSDSVWQAWQAEYARRAQVTAPYAAPPEDSATVPPRVRPRFYGPPNYEINLDEYTSLPTFLEVNRELLVGVRLREKNGRYDIDVFDIPNRTFLDGEPTVLMDGVLTHDVDYLVNFPPEQIKWIETVNRRTYYGEYRFDGTVAVYTKLGDAYKPALPPSTLSTTIALYSPYRAFTAPEALPLHEPDFRTLLYWQPAVRLTGNPLMVTLANADELGEFEVIVEGITADGRPVYGRESYTVSLDEVP